MLSSYEVVFSHVILNLLAYLKISCVNGDLWFFVTEVFIDSQSLPETPIDGHYYLRKFYKK